jgi:radical SAM enzyme (rSAM/lipoprotein system)
MPLEDFLDALDTIEAPKDSITVVFTGGEPLMRKDLETCGRALRKMGFRWSMVSNGLMYTPERHNSLLNAGIGALTFSLDGFEESHNWLRGTSKSFEAVSNAISLVTKTPRINFDIVTCVNQKNLSELDTLYDFLTEKNVKAWRLFTITPIGRAKDYDELYLNMEQFTSLMEFIKIKRKENKIDIKFSCEGYVGTYEKEVRDDYFFCRAGINIGSVLINGDISACPNIDRSFAQGNIYKDNFFEVWNSRFEKFRDREWKKTGICENCKEFKYCLGNGFHHWHNNELLHCYNKNIT